MDELINLNTATVAQLRTIPGVGAALAKRIIAARPFSAFDDLRKVNGIGSTLLERMRTFVTLDSEIPGEEKIYEAESNILEVDAKPETGFILIESAKPEEDEAIPPWDGEATEMAAASPEVESELPAKDAVIPVEKAIIPIVAKPDNSQSSSKEKTISRGSVFMVAALCSFFAFMLATMVSLGSIAILNGGLRYASAAKIDEFSRQVDSLSLQTDILSGDLAKFEARLDTLETDFDSLETDLNDQVDQFSKELENLNNEVADLQESSQFFQTFLDGLRELINALPTP